MIASFKPLCSLVFGGCKPHGDTLALIWDLSWALNLRDKPQGLLSTGKIKIMWTNKQYCLWDAKINLQLWMSCRLPSAARRLCVVHPQGSSMSSLNHGDGDGGMVKGWCLPLLPPATFPDWPDLLSQTLAMLWAAPACWKTFRTNGSYVEKHTLLCSWFLRTANNGAGMSGRQPALSTSISSRQGASGL